MRMLHCATLCVLFSLVLVFPSRRRPAHHSTSITGTRPSRSSFQRRFRPFSRRSPQAAMTLRSFSASRRSLPMRGSMRSRLITARPSACTRAWAASPGGECHESQQEHRAGLCVVPGHEQPAAAARGRLAQHDDVARSRSRRRAHEHNRRDWHWQHGGQRRRLGEGARWHEPARRRGRPPVQPAPVFRLSRLRARQHGVRAARPVTLAAEHHQQEHGLFQVQQFATPQWRVTRPYSYRDPSRFRADPPVNSNPDNPGYRQQADEVLAASAALTDEQKAMAELFDNKLRSLGFSALFVAQSRGFTLDQFVHYDFLVNVAAFDAGIAAWNEKFRHDAVRPFSAIRHLYGDRRVTAWGGPGQGTVRLRASEWRSYLNTADHPSIPPVQPASAQRTPRRAAGSLARMPSDSQWRCRGASSMSRASRRRRTSCSARGTRSPSSKRTAARAGSGAEFTSSPRSTRRTSVPAGR